MDTFYSPVLQENTTIQLNKDESFHLFSVLRKREGEQILVIDGNGMKAAGKIVVADKIGSMIQVGTIMFQSDKNFHTLAIAPTKHMDRFEYFVEKSIEMGIHGIAPILTKNSERKVINSERIHKIMLSAVKQSRAFYLPILYPIQKFSSLIQQEDTGEKYVATCIKDAPLFQNVYRPNQKSIIFVGPEGDFAEDEVINAIENKANLISLGENRLRVETAGILICATITLLNQKNNEK